MTGPNNLPMRSVPRAWIAKRLMRIAGVEGRLESVERRGADVAIDHADRAEHELRKRFCGAVVGGDIVRAHRAVDDACRHAKRCLRSRIKIPCGFLRCSINTEAR